MRDEFLTELAGVPVEDLVFLDECGVNTNLVRRTARSKRGSRAPGTRPANRGKNVTVIAAIGLMTGVIANRTYEGAMNTTRFLAWLDESLLPRLQPGMVVVMDNLRVHHVADVRLLVEAAGCRLVYLPPYSPDLNPIELAWSKLKTYLRGRAERTTDRVRRAVHWGIRTIRDLDIAGWFTHCGWE